MTSAPRVLFVTRRFWPLANDNIWRLLSLAGALRNAGWEPQVLTAQWHAAWPAKITLRDIEIHRLGPSPTTPFRSRRYTRSVCDWIASRTSQFDCIIIDALEEDAVGLTSHKGMDWPPILVRYDALESGRPLEQRPDSKVTSVCQCAARVLIPHEHARRELVISNVSDHHVVYVPDVTPVRRIVDERTRWQARRACADINHELHLRADDRLIVTLADFTKQSGLDLLIHALGPIMDSRRGFRCWIVGEGPERSRIYDMLRRQGWRNDFLMPGTFEDAECVLSAADLCVLPGASQGLAWTLPAAVSSNLATLVCDSPSARARLGFDAQEIVFEQGNSLQLKAMLESWCINPRKFQNATEKISRHLMGAGSVVDCLGQTLGRLTRSRQSFNP